jgi:predicted RNA-binding protein associated with RNAse of E/G family
MASASMGTMTTRVTRREYTFVAVPPKRVRLHYHRPGRGTVVFHEDLLVDRPDLKVTLLSEYDGRAAFAGERVILDAGAPVVWFVFPHLCRDVGRFHLADGTFTGWYTNIRAPARFVGDDWQCVDLFLDHWVPAAGAPSWLDEDEFAAARAANLVSDVDARLVADERATVDRLVTAGAWPPPVAREITLDLAREMLRA